MAIVDQMAVVSIKRYINLHHGGNNSDFARAVGVSRQTVQKWITGGWWIGGGVLFSPKRDLININKKAS